MKKLNSLSIFLPAYNEAANISEAIYQAIGVAEKISEKYEVLVINDGSQDATKFIAERVAKKEHHVRVITQRNVGYGGALKRGFEESQYEWIFFTDSDLQFDMNELQKYVKYTTQNQMILGYRKTRAEGLKRKLLANALKVWNLLLLNFPKDIKDIDCAFKLIHSQVVKTISPLHSDGAMISTELLLKATKQGFSYKQVGVKHFIRRAGNPTGSSIKVIFKAIKDTFSLRKMIRTEKKQYRYLPTFKS